MLAVASMVIMVEQGHIYGPIHCQLHGRDNIYRLRHVVDGGLGNYFKSGFNTDTDAQYWYCP